MVALIAELCANCGRTIGRLETPCVWQEQVVCQACHQRLVPIPIAYAAPAASPPLVQGADGPPIICPNPQCGYRGPSVRKAKGSTAVAIILFLLWILPGIIYIIACQGYTLSCPQCGIKLRDA